MRTFIRIVARALRPAAVAALVAVMLPACAAGPTPGEGLKPSSGAPGRGVALDEQRQLARLYLSLGEIYDRDFQERERAVGHYRRYLELEPQGEGAERVRRRLKELGVELPVEKQVAPVKEAPPPAAAVTAPPTPSAAPTAPAITTSAPPPPAAAAPAQAPKLSGAPTPAPSSAAPATLAASPAATTPPAGAAVAPLAPSPPKTVPSPSAGSPVAVPVAIPPKSGPAVATPEQPPGPAASPAAKLPAQPAPITPWPLTVKTSSPPANVPAPASTAPSKTDRSSEPSTSAGAPSSKAAVPAAPPAQVAVNESFQTWTARDFAGTAVPLVSKGSAGTIILYWEIMTPRLVSLLGGMARLASPAPGAYRALSMTRKGSPDLPGYLHDKGIDLPVIEDGDGRLAAALGVGTMPALAILDGDGRLVKLVSGWDGGDIPGLLTFPTGK